MKTKIKITVDTVAFGSVWLAGTTVELDAELAAQLVKSGVAELVKSAKSEPVK